MIEPTLMLRCSCEGPWPCPLRRWWNRWRHEAVVDMAWLLEKMKRDRDRMRAEFEALGGAPSRDG